MPSFVEIGHPVPEKIFALIDPVVSEEKIFEFVDRQLRSDAGPWVYYKLTCESSAQVS